MDTTYGKAVAYAIPVFLGIIILGIIADRWKGPRYYHRVDAINSLSCGIISTGFLGAYLYELAYRKMAPIELAAKINPNCNKQAVTGFP